MSEPTKLMRLDSEERKKRTPEASILAACALLGGERVCDVGAGAGFWTLLLLRSPSPAAHVDAVEPDPELLEALRSRLTEQEATRVALHAASAERLPIADGSVDLATFGNVLHELGAFERALSEAHRVLRPGGRVIVVDWPPPKGPAEDAVRRGLEGAGFVRVTAISGFPGLVALSATRTSR